MTKEIESRQVLLQTLKKTVGIDDELIDEFVRIIPNSGIQRINHYRLYLYDKKVNLAHYAALSGTVEALNWVRQNRPELLDKSDENQRLLVYYAMYSECVDALNWIKENKSELFDQGDKWGNTLAHFAARTGSIKTLDWLKENRPDLLIKLNSDGDTIAHEAGHSLMGLDWVKKNTPKLLDKLNTNGNSFIYDAVLSGRPEQLDFAITLSMEPSKLTLSSGWFLPSDLTCIVEMLESNFTLTQCKIEATSPWTDGRQNIYNEIQMKIARNCIIQRIITEMKTQFGDLYYSAGRRSLLHVKQTFLDSLPQELTASQKKALFQSTFIQASPINRAITLIGKEINRMRVNSATAYRVFPPASESILSALQQLSELFSSKDATLETIQVVFNTWKESNKDYIDTKGFTLFKDSSIRELVDKIQMIFDDWTRAQTKDVSDEYEPFTRPGFHSSNDEL